MSSRFCSTDCSGCVDGCISNEPILHTNFEFSKIAAAFTNLVMDFQIFVTVFSHTIFLNLPFNREICFFQYLYLHYNTFTKYCMYLLLLLCTLFMVIFLFVPPSFSMHSFSVVYTVQTDLAF